MHVEHTIFLILLAILLGAISPGPAALFIARTAVVRSRRDGLACAFGVVCAGQVYCTMGLFGLAALLARYAWLSTALKVAGGLYLLCLAAKIWSTAKIPLPLATRDFAANGKGPDGLSVFLSGFVTQMTNPKAIVVYGTIFASLLPPVFPVWLYYVLSPLIFLIETSWYAAVAWSFSATAPRAFYLRWKSWIERVAASVLALMSVRLLGTVVLLDV